MKAVTTAQMRELDRRTIAAGTPSAELMDRAGQAVARTVQRLLAPHANHSVLLFAGKGNNGGDAIVAARYLANAGCTTTLILLGRRTELTGDPLFHFQKLIGVEVREWPCPLPTATVVVDGLLGTGLSGDVREPYRTAIQAINDSPALVVAIDIPSGLGTSSCVRADVTVTMGLPKIDLLQPSAVDYVGRLEVADLGFPAAFIAALTTNVELITPADLVWPQRRRSAHKGHFGHLLIVAGSEGYTGAPVLCAHAAARSGVGRVTLAVPRSIYPIVAAQSPPEVMPRPLDSLAGQFDAVAIGPGLGHGAKIPQFDLPTVLDADALDLRAIRPGMVLTPHPGEMARLTGKSAAEVQSDRWAVARQFAREHHVTLVLKGAGTVVTDANSPLWINATGNPGMAKGGMGDALTGLIGGLLAQGLSPLDAARTGVYLHGLAGDRAAARIGATAFLTTDLIESLGAAWHTLHTSSGRRSSIGRAVDL